MPQVTPTIQVLVNTFSSPGLALAELEDDFPLAIGSQRGFLKLPLQVKLLVMYDPITEVFEHVQDLRRLCGTSICISPTCS